MLHSSLSRLKLVPVRDVTGTVSVVCKIRVGTLKGVCVFPLNF